MKALGNDSHITYVQVNEQKVHPLIKYYEEKTNFLGMVSRKEGFYEILFSEEIIPLIKVPTNTVLNGKTAFLKANIVIYYSSGNKYSIYFASNEEMYLYIKREFQGRHWRELN